MSASTLTREELIDELYEIEIYPEIRPHLDNYLQQFVYAKESVMVELLLKAGVNPNPKDGLGYYLQHLFHEYKVTKSTSGDLILELMRVLLEGGANPNRVWCNNYRAYDYAVNETVEPVARLLERYGADQEIREYLWIPDKKLNGRFKQLVGNEFRKIWTQFCSWSKKLFTEVFADSEGQVEGDLIGNLAFELQETTEPEELFGFIAKDDKTLIGCIFFTRLAFDNQINAFILSPVAVTTQYQKQGVGQKLIQFGINNLKKKNVKLLFTYGDPNFYSKVGFKAISENIAKAPFKLTCPEGWLAQSLVGEDIEPISGNSTCVSALNHQQYW